MSPEHVWIRVDTPSFARAGEKWIWQRCLACLSFRRYWHHHLDIFGIIYYDPPGYFGTNKLPNCTPHITHLAKAYQENRNAKA